MPLLGSQAGSCFWGRLAHCTPPGGRSCHAAPTCKAWFAGCVETSSLLGPHRPPHLQFHLRRTTRTRPSGSWTTATWRTCSACSRRSTVSGRGLMARESLALLFFTLPRCAQRVLGGPPRHNTQTTSMLPALQHGSALWAGTTRGHDCARLTSTSTSSLRATATTRCSSSARCRCVPESGRGRGRAPSGC